MSPFPSRHDLTAATRASLMRSFAGARPDPAPYRHWLVSEVFPQGMASALRTLPFDRPELGGVSGARDLHNDQRHYFDTATIERFDICAAVAGAFQSSEVVGAIEAATGADLDGTYLRLEYAQDTDGFWLQPHTDLGVKKFTMLIYLRESPDQADLGTDLYQDPRTWVSRPPFSDNTALVFLPGTDTWHGFERRAIQGIRKSVIMNYVTEDWLAREQLAYPTTPVRA